MGGKVGVNIFCLIMGYFGIKSRSIRAEKMLKTELMVLFYSYFRLVLALIFEMKAVSVRSVIYTMFPTITEHYWFFNAYMIVFFFSKPLNKFLLEWNKETFIRILIASYIIWSIIPFFTLRENGGMFWTQLLWFFVMYITGAYFRLNSIKVRAESVIIVAVLSSLLMALSFVASEILALRFDMLKGYTTYFRWSNSPLSILMSISLFCIAIVFKPRVCRFVNIVSGTAFGIYLFYENIFVQPLLWRGVFNASNIAAPVQLVAHFAFSIIFVLVVGFFIELVRKRIEKLLASPLEKYSLRIEKFKTMRTLSEKL